MAVTPLPPAPSRTQDPDSFIATGDTFLAALGPMVTQINTLASSIGALAVGGALAIPYTFSTDTANSSPGAGYLKLNNVTQSNATIIRADVLANNSTDYTTLLDSFNDSTSAIQGFFRIQSIQDPTKFLIFSTTLTGIVSDYRNFTVSNITYSSTAPFANGESVVLYFDRSGDLASSQWLLLQNTSASASATIDMTCTGTYKAYMLTISEFVPATNATTLQLRMGLSGTFDTGANYYGHLNASASGATTYVGIATSAATSLQISPALSNAANASLGMVLFLTTTIANTTLSKLVHGQGTAVTGATAVTVCQFAGMEALTTAKDGLRFFMSSGNITSGVFKLYGLV